jgi:hypothetical protein
MERQVSLYLQCHFLKRRIQRHLNQLFLWLQSISNHSIHRNGHSDTRGTLQQNNAGLIKQKFIQSHIPMHKLLSTNSLDHSYRSLEEENAQHSRRVKKLMPTNKDKQLVASVRVAIIQGGSSTLRLIHIL